MQRAPRPPRKPTGALSRRAYLSGYVTQSMVACLLDDLPGQECISVVGVLMRLVEVSSPWVMLAPYSLWIAAYGLLAALESGELPPADYHALRRLSLHELCALVADVCANCRHPQDVLLYLTARALGRAA